MQQVAPTTRRVITTVPLHYPIASPVATSPRKHLFPASFPRTRKALASALFPRALPRSVIFPVCCITLALVYALLASLAPSDKRASPPPLTAALEAWRDPAYARARLRVYVYDLPMRFNAALVERSIVAPGPIRDPRCDTNFYSSEVHVHRFLQTAAVRTTEAAEADLFYVPVYATCDLLTRQPNDVRRVGQNFEEAMRMVREELPFWNRSDGRDHVYLFAQGFAGRLAGEWQKYANGVFMVHNGEFAASEYTPRKDVTIPPDLRGYLRPYWEEGEVLVERRPRKYLAQFGGQVVDASVSDHRGSNYSGGVRQYIQKHFSKRSDYRITGVRADTYLADMKDSNFCLAPEGWHPWSPRPYYGVLMGCIPVIISEVQEMAFEEFVDWDSFAVWIRPSHVAQLDKILRSFSESDLRARRSAMRGVWRAFWYAQGGLANEAIFKALYNRKYESAPRRYFSASR